MDQFPSENQAKRLFGQLRRLPNPLIFSIVTPSYKQLDYLRLCVASVRDQVVSIHGQTLPGIPERNSSAGKTASGSALEVFSPCFKVEHIIQDAGTPGIEDYAREVGAEYRSNGHLVFPERTASPTNSSYSLKVVNEPDDGMYDAINRGFRRANGGFMAWLNCDEQYLPGALLKVIGYFFDHPSTEILFGDALLADESGGILAYRRTVLPWRLHTQLSHLSTLSCSTFIRGSVIKRGLLLDATCKAIADAKWVARLLDEKVSMAVMQEPLAVFFLTQSNLGQSSLAYTETIRWKKELGILTRGLEFIVILIHRLKKLLAGAYGSHTVNSFVYLKGEEPKRRWTFSSKVPFSWPEKRSMEGELSEKSSFRKSCYEIFKNGLLLPILFSVAVQGIDRMVPEVTLTPFLSIFCLMCMAFFYSPVVVAMAAAIFSCGVFYSFLGFGNAMPDEPHNNLFILVRLAGFVISSAVAVLFSLFRQKAFYAQELTAAILSSLPIPVLITDATGVVSMSNQEMQRRLNMRQSQVFGKTWASLVMAMQDEGQATRTYIEIFAKSSTTGVDVPLRLAGNPSKDVPGRLLCIGKGERRLMVTVVVG